MSSQFPVNAYSLKLGPKSYTQMIHNNGKLKSHHVPTARVSKKARFGAIPAHCIVRNTSQVKKIVIALKKKTGFGLERAMYITLLNDSSYIV